MKCPHAAVGMKCSVILGLPIKSVFNAHDCRLQDMHVVRACSVLKDFSKYFKSAKSACLI